MKSAWNTFKNLILHGINGVPFDYYLFLFLFFSRVFELLIAGNIFSIFTTYEHEFLLFEKYTYFITAGYLFLYFLVYFIDQHRLPLNRCTFIALLYFITAVLSTVINMGKNLSYDYLTKLSLMELMMTILFMFYTASRLSESQFRKLMRVAGKGFVCLILLFNIGSLIVYFTQPAAESIVIFGRAVELPKVYFDDRVNRLYDSYAGFYRNSQTAGGHCPLALILSLYLFKRKELNPITTVLSIITNTSIVLMAHSRTGTITTAIIAVVYIGLLIKESRSFSKKALRWYFLILALTVFIGALITARKSIILYHTLNNDLFYTVDRIMSGRLSILTEIWRIVQLHPIIGEGWHVKILKYYTAHNFLLTAAAWTGIVGLILIVWLLVSVVRKGIKEKTIQKNPLLFLIPFTVFVQCLLDQGILGDARHAYTYMFWLVLGYFAADHKSSSAALIEAH